MSRNGINSGLKQGRLQGVKSGNGFAKMDGGIKKGMVSESGVHNKIQDPTLLQGSKKPSSMFLADFATATGAGATITALSELISGATAFTLNSSPAYQPPYTGNGGVYNSRAYIDFNSSADSVFTSSATMGSGKTELTVMMVVRFSSAAGTMLFYSVDSTISNTIGDITIQCLGGNRIRATFLGNPATTTSIYESYETLLEGNHWHLITVKFRLYQPNGPGSEVEIWTNGRLNMIPIVSTFTGSNSTFVGNSFFFGNNSSFTNAGSHIAAALTLDYWANPSEQMRLENFFRWYYGRKF
jgi:hypothetical protein